MARETESKPATVPETLHRPEPESERPYNLPRRSWRGFILRVLAWAVFFAAMAWAWNQAEIRPRMLWRDAANMGIYAKGFKDPDFMEWRLYAKEMQVTIAMALWGTILAVVMGVPFGLLSARNIAPIWIRQPVRRLMDICRGVNEMIFAFLFVTAVGLGPFPGVLALFIHTTGTLAKLFSEAVESIDPQPVEGIRASGAGMLEEIAFGVIPQVMPLWISYSLYRFESNVRSATVVGLIGAGGIGMLLLEAIRGFQYQATAALIIVIVVSVTVIDLISGRIRRIFT